MSEDSTKPSLERINRALPECVKMLGAEVLGFDDEDMRVDMAFEMKPEFCHSGNIGHGGIVTGMIDAAMAQVSMRLGGYDIWVASLEIKTSFFAPAHQGKMRASAWVRHRGGSILFAEGDLHRQDGVRVATASSTIKLVRPR